MGIEGWFGKKKVDPSEQVVAELTQTSPEIVERLTERAMTVASTAGTPEDRIGAADIRQTVYAFALEAERNGAPITEEMFADENALDGKLIDVMDARMRARPETGTVQ
jgi:hypothetical protein